MKPTLSTFKGLPIYRTFNNRVLGKEYDIGFKTGLITTE